MKKEFVVSGVFLLLVSCILPCSGKCATSVSYYGGLIIFNFNGDYPVGQFANGDYWVHNNGGNVEISSISPASIDNGTGRIINGTMLNPANSTVQGYDSSPRDMSYSNAVNVDPGNTGNPLVVPPSSSVVKSISMADTAGRPIISDAAVLTVLQEAPPAGSFRPPYTGYDKSIIATLADLDYSRLGAFKRLGDEPEIQTIAGNFERVWLEHCTEWVQRDIHPKNNMPTYGRDIANSSGTGLLLLQLDYSQEEKKPLLIGLVQYGIDLYGIARTGGNWYNNGGHNLGRKLPLLLAGKVLNNNAILEYADKEKYFIFQDDQQHFYVSQVEVDITNGPTWDPDDRAPTVPYASTDIGMPEWGIRHADRPQADNKHWSATYRHVNGPAQTKHTFAAMLMGARDIWNWPPLFDYADRYYAAEKNTRFQNYFVALWDEHRNSLAKKSSLLQYIPVIIQGDKIQQ